MTRYPVIVRQLLKQSDALYEKTVRTYEGEAREMYIDLFRARMKECFKRRICGKQEAAEEFVAKELRRTWSMLQRQCQHAAAFQKSKRAERNSRILEWARAQGLISPDAPAS